MLMRQIMDALEGHGIDRNSLAHHLNVAAMEYDGRAKSIMAGVTDTSPVADSSRRLRDQFNAQAEQARMWADLFTD